MEVGVRGMSVGTIIMDDCGYMEEELKVEDTDVKDVDGNVVGEKMATKHGVMVRDRLPDGPGVVRLRLVEEYISKVSYEKMFVFLERTDDEKFLCYVTPANNKEQLSSKYLIKEGDLDNINIDDLLMTGELKIFVGRVMGTIVIHEDATKNMYRDANIGMAINAFVNSSKRKANKRLLKALSKVNHGCKYFDVTHIPEDTVGVIDITYHTAEDVAVIIPVSYCRLTSGELMVDVDELIKQLSCNDN